MPPTPRDLTSHEPWHRSLLRSRERRAALRRRRVVRRRGRGGTTVLIAAMTLAAGGALAHEQRATSSAAKQTATAAMVKQGSRGEAVRQVQRALGIAADGIFGKGTHRAVRSFQKRRGLAVDGVVGPATRAALGLSAAPAPTAPRDRVTSRSAPAGDVAATLARIAVCESGGDPTAVSRDGRYRGKYQFDRATWRSIGGQGDPAAAPEAEQDRLAAKLFARRGTSPWGACAKA